MTQLIVTDLFVVQGKHLNCCQGREKEKRMDGVREGCVCACACVWNAEAGMFLYGE